MPRQSDVLTLYRVARYCYKDGMNQKQIAAVENLSRSQISRLLDKARELGIVKVSVHLPSEFNLNELSSTIKSKLGLKNVIIAPAGPSDAGNDIRLSQIIATAAADYLSGNIQEGRIIGVGWGKTIYETSLQLTYIKNGNPPYFVPLIGMSGDDAPYLQINAIIDRFCEKFKCRGLFTNIPAIREKHLPYTKLENDRLSNLRKLWGSLDMAIIGLGNPPDRSDVTITEFSDDYSIKLAQSGTRGDILAQYFYPDGKVFSIEDRYEHVAFDINKLKSIKSVICLAGGAEKVNGIITAAKCGFIKTLITDSITAGTIFEMI